MTAKKYWPAIVIIVFAFCTAAIWTASSEVLSSKLLLEAGAILTSGVAGSAPWWDD